MEKKQSSINWLISCITEDQMVKSKSLNEWLEIFEQAKAMHKEQIINPYEQGEEDAYWHPEIGYSRKYKDSEQYYNETFNK